MIGSPNLLYDPNRDIQNNLSQNHLPSDQKALNLSTHDIPGAQPKQVSKVSTGLKRHNFFEDNLLENLHLKDKYG